MAHLIDKTLIKTKIASDDEITFDTNALKLLEEIGKNKTIRQIATETELSPIEFKRSLKKLFTLKMVKLETSDPRFYVSESFIEFTRNFLIQIAGPLGEILLTETAEQMELDTAQIPIEMVDEFISNIANQVPAQKQREKFRAVMLEQIKMLKGYGSLGYHLNRGDLN
jgi:hypothetical protein